MGTKDKRLPVLFLCLCVVLLLAPPVAAEDVRNDATAYTVAINTAENLSKTWQNLNDDIEYANRGFLAAPESPVILSAAGRPVLNLTTPSYLRSNTAPTTVNVALYEHARLNNIRGLFQVTDSIYQVRGYDISVVSLSKERPAGSSSTRWAVPECRGRAGSRYQDSWRVPGKGRHLHSHTRRSLSRCVRGYHAGEGGLRRSDRHRP